MRISDWNSDVGSSDLGGAGTGGRWYSWQHCRSRPVDCPLERRPETGPAREFARRSRRRSGYLNFAPLHERSPLEPNAQRLVALVAFVFRVAMIPFPALDATAA